MTANGFSPEAALDTIASLGSVLEEFQLDRRIILGAFVHPGQSLAEDLDLLRARLARHPLVAALAGDEIARESLTETALPEPVLGDRDPADEPGVGDLDRGQLHVLDAVAQGGHVLVDTPPGVDVPATVAAVVAQAVVAGQRVLYVPGTRRAAQGLSDAIRALGLQDVLLDLCGETGWRRTAVTHIVDGLDPEDPDVDAGEREADRADLVHARARLQGFVRALHSVRAPWSVSAHQALQALAFLTSQKPGPRTQVRLSGEVLRLDHDGRGRAREELARAAALGSFRLRAADTPWFGAELTSAEHAVSTLESVRSLSDLMPTLLEQIDSTSAQTGLDEAGTFTEWAKQLALLEGIRSSLDVFSSHVFERSAKDMAAATAPRAWRAERHVELSWSERRALRRRAKDLIRPGVNVPDLHEQLVAVERRREQWRKLCSGGAWPHIPSALREKTSTYREADQLIDALGPVLAPTLGGQDLREIPLRDLATRLQRLGTDDAALRQMPERAAALSVLNSLGLGPLVQDLTSRRVPTDLVGAEFDLAWWSSVLEEMLAGDPALSELDTEALGTITADLRELEQSHIDSRTAPVRKALRRRVRAAIEADRYRAQEFYKAAHAGSADLKDVLDRFGEVAAEPRPVWLVPPMVVPTVLPASDQVDLLILDAVTHLPIEHAIAAIARARQVVVVGDTRRGGTGLVQALSWLPTVSLAGDRMDQDPEISAFLAAHGYRGLVLPVPAPPRPSPVTLDVVDGSGMPAPEARVVESAQAEVDRVVDLVIDHALTHPEESLAVIALNTRHADRVREAVASTVSGSRSLERFFDPGKSESFTVVEVEAAAGLRRDAIILTLGYGKTPHGRVLHSFGSISGPDGAAYLIDALDAVRRRLSVVSCFDANDLDPHRLRHAGSEMLRSLLQFARDGAAPAEPAEEPVALDPLLSDLTERLRLRGLRVVPHYGRPSGVRIPLAVGHPALPGELVLAVLTDDADYVAEPSLRIRDRHWVQRLENRGWVVRMVFSTAVFMDPQGVAEQIAAQVSDIVAERTGTPVPAPSSVPPAAFTDDDLVTTTATLSALRGEQIAGRLDAPEVAARTRTTTRPERPDVSPGRPLGDYGDDELDALVAWIGSDGEQRDAEQLRTALAAELGLKRRGKHINAVLGHAVDRSGLAVSVPGTQSVPDGESSDGKGDDEGVEVQSGDGEDTDSDVTADPTPSGAGGKSPAVEQPQLAWEDDPRAWGDADGGDDERILSERPPHWD